MKFILDENLPPSLVEKLKSIGYESYHVNEVGYSNTADSKIAALAKRENAVILTHDTDFGTIMALNEDDKPSIILFRWQTISVNSLFLFLEEYLPQLEIDLEKGSFIVVDDNKIRVRTLPLVK